MSGQAGQDQCHENMYILLYIIAFIANYQNEPSSEIVTKPVCTPTLASFWIRPLIYYYNYML